MQDGTRRIRALLAVARSDFGKFFPAQTHPVVPGLSHAVPRREILLVELVALQDLRESGFHREIFGVQNGVGGADCGGMVRIARRRHGQAAHLRILKGERVVAAQGGRGVENLQRIDRQRFEGREANSGPK